MRNGGRRLIATAMRDKRLCRRYSPGAGAAASANGLPSESRHTTQRSPGWMIDPPSSRQGGGVAGARSTLVDSEAQAIGVGLPPGSGRGGPWREDDPDDPVPEPAGAIGIVGRKLNQWRGHGRSMAARTRLSSARDATPLKCWP